MKRTQILMIVGRYHPEISGGNLQCKKLIDNLNKEFLFEILTFTKNKKLNYYRNQKKFKISRIYSSEGMFSKIIKLLKIIKFFYKNSKNFKIVHIFGISKVNIFFILLSKLYKKKIIVKFSSFGEDDLDSVIKKSYLNFLLHKLFCDKFICNAPIFLNQCLKYDIPRNKIIQIPNILLQKKNFDKNFKIKINNKFKNVLCVGHFSDEKRHLFSYKVWKNAFLKGYKSNLIFVGRSNESFYEVNSEIKKKIIFDARKNKIFKNIYFFEFIDSMAHVYKKSDIFLMPSLREGMPNSLIESIYHGLECICLKLPSIKNFLNYRNLKFLNYDSNPDIWTKMLIIKLNKKGKKKINKKIEKNFKKTKILNKYRILYKTINE